jgi:hypothetical protein
MWYVGGEWYIKCSEPSKLLRLRVSDVDMVPCFWIGKDSGGSRVEALLENVSGDIQESHGKHVLGWYLK